MKKTAGLIAAVILFLFLGTSAESSWLMDPKDFHISAHGQISCRDCHQEVADSPHHPDPRKVNGRKSDFFNPDLCLSCHGNVQDDLKQGRHGRREIENPEKYRTCMPCHRAHYQPRLGNNRIASFVAGKPRREQCGACHKPETKLPPLSREDEACMACHGLAEKGDPKQAEKISGLCFDCHGLSGPEAKARTDGRMPLIDQKAYAKLPHASVACTACHPDAARFGHADQRVGDCRQCHLPHDEKIAHDAHMGVSCEACHLQGVQPFKQKGSGLVLWTKANDSLPVTGIHRMVLGSDESTCKRCHFSGNTVGAAAMVLPAKGVLCMPCHVATFSVGDTTTILTLLAFLAGFFLLLSYWFSGSIPEDENAGPLKKGFTLLGNALRAVFSARFLPICKTLFLDVILQRRLYRRSRSRWLIHSLIFLPFVFRFFWGLAALLMSQITPGWPIWFMLDKNAPVTGFLFDLSGILILAGLTLALGRGLIQDQERLPGLPRQDRVALGLIGGVVVLGFVLEGMRIAMTGWPAGSAYAFLGYAISFFFWVFSGLNGAYGYLWYLHAIATGAFIAYLPFSRLIHVIIAPLVLAGGAASARDHGQEKKAEF